MDPGTSRIYGLKAGLIQAIAHPIRLAIVDFLAGGEQCVCDIARHVGAKRSNVSRHLAVMLKAGILDCRKDGLRVIYSMKTPCIAGFLACVTNVLRERMERDNDLLRGL